MRPYCDKPLQAKHTLIGGQMQANLCVLQGLKPQIHDVGKSWNYNIDC